MKLGPGARTGAEGQQTHGFATVAKGEDEQPRASILTALSVANHGTTAIINLCFFTGSGDDYGTGFWGLQSAKPAHEALDAPIATRKAGLGNQILPDSHGIAPLPQAQLDGAQRAEQLESGAVKILPKPAEGDDEKTGT